MELKPTSKQYISPQKKEPTKSMTLPRSSIGASPFSNASSKSKAAIKEVHSAAQPNSLAGDAQLRQLSQTHQSVANVSRFSSWQVENVNINNNQQKDNNKDWDELLNNQQNSSRQESFRAGGATIEDEVDLASPAAKQVRNNDTFQEIELSDNSQVQLNSGTQEIENLIDKLGIMEYPREADKVEIKLKPMKQISNDSWDTDSLEEQKTGQKHRRKYSFVNKPDQIQSDSDIEEVIEIVDVGRQVASSSVLDEEDILEEVTYEDDFAEDEALIDDEMRKAANVPVSQSVGHAPAQVGSPLSKSACKPRSIQHSGSQGKVITLNKFSSSQAIVVPDSPPQTKSTHMPSRRATVIRKDRQEAKKKEEEEDEMLLNITTPSDGNKKEEVDDEDEEEEDDIDLFLRQAMDPIKKLPEKEDELIERRRGKMHRGENTPHKKKIADSDDDDEEGEGSGEFDVLTAKQQLINGLGKLSGKQGNVQHSQAELEGFLNDLENILKVVTFKETVEYILPCISIFVDESEQLRANLFRKLHCVCEKMMKSPARQSTADSISQLSKQIFPHITQILCCCDSEVHEAAIVFFTKISCRKTGCLDQEPASELIFGVIENIAHKVPEFDQPAKVSILRLMQAFSELEPEEEKKVDKKLTKKTYEEMKPAPLLEVEAWDPNVPTFPARQSILFTEQQCTYFIKRYLPIITGKEKTMILFKVKKQLLPCLMATGYHLEYDLFLKHTFDTFKVFAADCIWGVRKISLEIMPHMIEKLETNETERLSFCLEFLATSLNDESKQVRNQAYQQFGRIAHAVYEKAMSWGGDGTTLKTKIREVSDKFYSMSRLDKRPETAKKEEEDKRMQNITSARSSPSNENEAGEDIEAVKHNWAYNMPCVLLINGGRSYWVSKILPIYRVLYKDPMVKVRQSLAAGLIEVAKMLELQDEQYEEEDQEELQVFLLEVANYFMGDEDEKVRRGLEPMLIELVSLFSEKNRETLLNTLIKDRMTNEDKSKHTTQIKMGIMETMFGVFPPHKLFELDYHLNLFTFIKDEQNIVNRKRAAKVLGSQVIVPLIKIKSYRKTLTDFIDMLRLSKNFRDRQMYLIIAKASLKQDEEIFKKHFAKAIGNEMIDEKVQIVKILLAKVIAKVQRGYSKSADKVFEKLLSEDEFGEVAQFLGELGHPNKNKFLVERKFIDVNEHKMTLKQDELSQTLQSINSSLYKSQGGINMSHSGGSDNEEGEAQELAAIQSIEKSVNIKFCNYSIIMKAQNFPSGISSQLLQLLGGYGSMVLQAEAGDKSKVVDASEEALLGKAKKFSSQTQDNKKASDEIDEEYDDDDW